MQLSNKQMEVWRTKKRRWNLLTGAVQSGKTYLSFFLMLKRLCEQPPGAVAIIGKTERTLKRNVINPMRDLMGSNIVSRVHGDGLITIAGRECYLYGANDERATHKIQGARFAYAYGDEFATWPEEFFNMLRSRLSVPGACFDGTCNPEGPRHWVKTEIIDKVEGEELAPKNAPIKLTRNYFHFTIDDNPFLDEDYVTALKTEYKGMWYKRYVLGLWAAAEGAIYDMFDETVHVVNSLPEIKRWFTAVDYGTVNPCVFYLIGMGVDNCFYVVDEWRWDSSKRSGIQKTDKQYSTEYVKFVQKWNVRPEWCFIDPSAQSFITQMHHDKVHGVYEADNAVLDGIRRTATLFGIKKLKIHKRCTGLIDEILGYIWDEKAAETGDDIPQKKDDHGPDALRYFVNGTMHIWTPFLKAAEEEMRKLQ